MGTISLVYTLLPLIKKEAKMIFWLKVIFFYCISMCVKVHIHMSNKSNSSLRRTFPAVSVLDMNNISGNSWTGVLTFHEEAQETKDMWPTRASHPPAMLPSLHGTRKKREMDGWMRSLFLISSFRFGFVHQRTLHLQLLIYVVETQSEVQ